VEFEDWHTPSVSSSSGGSDTGSDGDDYVRPAFSAPWPKRTRFIEDQPGDGHGPTPGGAAAPAHHRSTAATSDAREEGGFLVGSVVIPWKPVAPAADATGEAVVAASRGGTLVDPPPRAPPVFHDVSVYCMLDPMCVR
jgi:hypothetical protein